VLGDNILKIKGIQTISKIACFAIGDQNFTYHLRYKMVSENKPFPQGYEPDFTK
jgi:hypothetical protein